MPTLICLRRRLAREDRPCFEARFDEFAAHARRRLDRERGRHLVLHIPKTGGTSLCDLAKRANRTVPGGNWVDAEGNCWEFQHHFPLWFYGNLSDRREWRVGCDGGAPCDELDGDGAPEFLMNENYLDHPPVGGDDARLHSVLLREPLRRSLSHERHLADFRRLSDASTYAARVGLARHNYMTWALASDAMPFGERASLKPGRAYLEIAKDALSQLDFLLEFSHNATCERITLRLMGVGGGGVGRSDTWKKRVKRHHKRGGMWPQKRGRVDWRSYEEWNRLDAELHEYARGLMELDCEFFLWLERRWGRVPG